MVRLPNSRHLRAIVALFVVMCLVAVMLVANHRERELRYQITLKISSLYWNISELFYETNMTMLRLREYNLGLATVRSVQDRIDILWSRVGNFERTHLTLAEEISDEMVKMGIWLEEAERDFFGKTPPSAEQSMKLRENLSILSSQIRASWIENYLADRRGITSAELSRIESRAELLITLILGCVVILTFYLIAELYYASKSELEESKLRETALEGTKAKTRFLSKISHEIRTPLNGIIGMTQDLCSTKLSSAQQQSIDIIKEASYTLLNMVNNVLEIAALEAGDTPLRRVPVEISGVINHVLEAYGGRANEKSTRLTHEPVSGSRRVIESDPERLVAILGHIVAEAIKRCSQTEIVVSGGLEEIDDGDAVLVFNIEAKPSDAQVEEGVKPCSEAVTTGLENAMFESGNSGLDLSLASQICRIMNGKLNADMSEHEDYSVTCEIPVRLARSGVQIDLSDMYVPGTESIAGDDPSLTQIPQSLGGNSEDLKVLIVDDSATNRLVLRKLLQGLKLELSEVDDGEKAVKNCADHSYDIVLMDIHMPVLDGIEATKRIREMEQSTCRPKSKIMAVTANVLPQQVDEYFKVGMDDVLAKPLNKVILLSRLSALVGYDDHEQKAASSQSEAS